MALVILGSDELTSELSRPVDLHHLLGRYPQLGTQTYIGECHRCIP